MLFRQNFILSLALVLLTASACLGSSVYVVNAANQFGTIDLATGAFHLIDPNTPGQMGLALGPSGSLLSLAFSGSLESINPGTGLTSVIGPTGLAACATPADPCGPTGTNTIGGLAGTVYVTDLSNKLYRVNTVTGAATLIGATGIPALPFTPLSENPDGTFNAYDEALFGANGKLYATFDAFTVNSTTFTTQTIVIPDNLYQIDPTTGATTVIGPTPLFISAVADVNGTFYTFNNDTSQILTIDLANGSTSVVRGFDPAAGIIIGAAPTPEPFSVALTGIGMGAIICWRFRNKR